MIKSKTKFLQSKPTLILPLLLLFTGLALAGDAEQMIIDVITDDFRIDELDISHLAHGDSETIYTEDGRTIDILRRERGIEIFLDGESLDLPSFSHTANPEHEAHDGHTVVVRIECDTDDEVDCHDHPIDLEGDWGIDGAHEPHKVVVIKKTVEAEDEI